MIRISDSPSSDGTMYVVEGRAQGDSGLALRRFLEEGLVRLPCVVLDLGGLSGIDEPTLEFLVRVRDRIQIARAPEYLGRWMNGFQIRGTP